MSIELVLQVLAISAGIAGLIIWALGDQIEQRYHDEHPVRRFFRLTAWIAGVLLAVGFLSTFY